MVLFKGYEIAGKFGGLDDDCLADGEPVSAHVLREMLRNGNRLKAKGDLMFRYVARADTNAETGESKLWAPPIWIHAINVPSIPVPKKAGLTKMRMKIRATIDNAANVAMYIGTSEKPTPDGRPSSEFLDLAGNGALQTYTFSNIAIREDAGERLSFYIKALVNTTDSAMNTGTFGAPATGTVDGGAGNIGQFVEQGATWNRTGSTPANGGHYVYFWTDSGKTALKHGPAWIIDVGGQTGATTDTLYFYPYTALGVQMSGSYFDIRKLPSVKIHSIACYSQSAT